MIKLRIAEQADIDYLKTVALEPAVKQYPELTARQPAYVAEWQNKVIAGGGVVMFWEGVGEAWLMFAKDAEKCGTQLIRAVSRMADIMMNKHGLKRLQAVVRTDFEKAIKLVELVGFTREGTLKNYCPDGADVYMYARYN